MGEARQAIDQMTKAVTTRDLEALAAVYAEDAVAETPDEGVLKGRDQIVDYLGRFIAAVPDFRWEEAHKSESADTAVDEGWIVGTNTGALTLPNGETVPATGKPVRLRECDIATVSGGLITSHRFYFDQMDLLGQLGLSPAQS